MWEPNKRRVSNAAAVPAWFNNDTWATFKIAVPFAKVRQAKIDKVKADKMPKDTFAVMNLAEMKVVKLPGAKELKTSAKGALYAYTYEVTPVKDTTVKDSAAKGNKPRANTTAGCRRCPHG